MIDKLEEYIHKIRESKTLKNKYRTSILTDLDVVLRFLKTSPGIISPAKVDEKIELITVTLKNPWCQVLDSSLITDLTKLLANIRKDYILLEGEERVVAECPTERDKDILSLPEEDLLDKGTVISALPKRILRLLDVDIQKGDVSLLPIGPCQHYCLVYKIIDDITYVIPITSTPGVFVGYPITKSRFFKGMAIFSIQQFPTALVRSKLAMPYDNKSECYAIFRAFEENIRSIVPRKKKIKAK